MASKEDGMHGIIGMGDETDDTIAGFMLLLLMYTGFGRGETRILFY